MDMYDSTARGSDVPRSFQQYLARKFGAMIVSGLRLNQGGFVGTEIIQQINPVCKIATSNGDILCKGGHGRLRWRAKTFYTEEPQTITWLGGLKPTDILWDVGANVGLYSIYAAKQCGCKVFAFEPEAQNFALLIENIFLNHLEDKIEASNLAITRNFGLGRLYVHDMTKGGAYNQFNQDQKYDRTAISQKQLSQINIGVSLDDLIVKFGLEYPTHIKVDVDGIEPDIIAGATQVLDNHSCKNLLIEVETDNPEHQKMVQDIKNHGFRLLCERSNWDSRKQGDKFSQEYPVINMIFGKE
jgi:FkbM family methyltransferase